MSEIIIEETLNALQAAKEADAARKAAIANLEQILTKTMRKLLPKDFVIDLDLKSEILPGYLMSVVTLKGSDRGTKRFRVENVVRVEIDLNNSNLSRWYADAVPISMKTGKDMSAKPGNRRSALQTTVRLAGYIDVLNRTENRDQSIFNLLEYAKAVTNRLSF